MSSPENARGPARLPVNFGSTRDREMRRASSTLLLPTPLTPTSSVKEGVELEGRLSETAETGNVELANLHAASGMSIWPVNGGGDQGTAAFLQQG